MAEPHSPFPGDHPPVRWGRVAVVLVNLGTPEAAEPKAVRRYLREFLSDRRVVDYPRAVWFPILHGIILNTRPPRVAKLYRAVWNEASDESPLRHYTRLQAEGLQARLGDDVTVDFAMRYGVPALGDRIEALMAAGHDRILIAPLYPQYSATTTGTVIDRLGEVVRTMPWVPSLRTLPPFHDEKGYIDALEASVRRHLPDRPERIIISFHGIPQRYFDAGDPYHCHCQKTARLLRERFGWDEHFAPTGFQSQFGPEKWLEPSTESLVMKAAEEGLKDIAVIAPAFVSDCIETLEEIALGLAEVFEDKGGERLRAVPCLNDDSAFIDCLAGLAERELGGWVDLRREAQVVAAE